MYKLMTDLPSRAVELKSMLRSKLGSLDKWDLTAATIAEALESKQRGWPGVVTRVLEVSRRCAAASTF